MSDPREKIGNLSRCTDNLNIGSNFKLFITKVLMKTETKLEIKCKDVEFQYRIAISEKIQMDILGLKNAIKISISEIKISMIGFNRRLGKNVRIVK